MNDKVLELSEVTSRQRRNLLLTSVALMLTSHAGVTFGDNFRCICNKYLRRIQDTNNYLCIKTNPSINLVFTFRFIAVHERLEFRLKYFDYIGCKRCSYFAGV